MNILIVGNSEDDTLLLERVLRRGGHNPTFERVETAATMKAALGQQTWDLVISDYSMPHFNGLDALTLLKESGLDLPFIIVSNAIGEETVAEAMRAGAHDYIVKGNLTRLVPAIERELRDAEVRRERKKDLIKKIERAKQEWESTVDSLPELVCLVDDRGHIIRANRTVETWNLGRVTDVKGREFHQLLHPDCAGSSCYLSSLWKQAWEKAVQGQPAQCEAYDETLKRHVSVQVQPWKDWEKGTLIGSTVVIVRDISEQVAAHQMREHLTDMIVHDLRNPLSNIMSSLELMREAIVEGGEALPTPQLLGVATRGCERLFRLVDAALALRQLETAEVELIRVPVNPRELVEEVAEQMQPSALSRKHSLEVQVAPGMPDVPADRELIFRVLDNLLDNA
ncbi:MAG: response regulator, partial [Chloroflexi bacterium]|nr:response regulator [Chloroflexota bacterium]